MNTICYVDEERRDIDAFVQAMDSEGGGQFNIVDIHVDANLSLDELMTRLDPKGFDYLIVDYFLNQNDAVSYKGDEVLLRFNKKARDFPQMLLTNDDKNAIKVAQGIDVEIIRGKKEYTDDPELFAERINKQVEQYHLKLDTYSKELEELAQKVANDDELTLEEEERYIELDNFLDDAIDPTAIKVPDDLKKVSISNSDKLDDLINRTDQLIEKLKER